MRFIHIQWEPIISQANEYLFLFIMVPNVHGHDPTLAAALQNAVRLEGLNLLHNQPAECLVSGFASTPT